MTLSHHAQALPSVETVMTCKVGSTPPHGVLETTAHPHTHVSKLVNFLQLSHFLKLCQWDKLKSGVLVRESIASKS